MKKVKSFQLIIALVFVVIQTLQAQNESVPRQSVPGFEHYFGYSLGFDNIKEENLIPKIHTGILQIFSYGWELRRENYHRFLFRLGYGNIKTGIESEAVTWHAHTAIAYCLGFKILDRDQVQFYSGPRAAFTSSLYEYEVWDEAHAYWGNLLSLGLGNSVALQAGGRKSFLLHFDFTLLGLYTRPDLYRLYANEYWTFSHIMTLMNRHYRFGSVNHAFQLHASAEYRTPIFRSCALSLSFSLFYSRIRAEAGKPLQELTPKLSLGVWL